MKYLTKSLLFASLATALVSPASAITIGFNPAARTIGQTEQASYDLVVSDLGDEVLAGFALQINFEPSIAKGVSVDYTAAFGNNPANQLTDVLTSGQIFLLDVADLGLDLSAQPAEFILATITLEGINPGFTALTIDPSSSLTDEEAVSLRFSAGTASLTVVPDAGSSGSLLGMALLGVGFLRYRANGK